MELVSPTLYVTLTFILIHYLMNMLKESLIRLSHWVHLAQELPTASGYLQNHQLEDHISPMEDYI